MDFPGSLSITPLQPASNSDFGLHPFQQVVARVLSVTGTTAVLAIDGHPVVAQLTSADQGATLLSQRNAQFIVTELTDQVITLMLVQHDTPQVAAAGFAQIGPEVAVRLLEQNDIPVTTNNLMLARSVLNQHLPLTPGLLNEMLSGLTTFGIWDEAQADLAAALRAAGLPVTAEGLALASRQAAQTGEALSELIASLQAAGQNLPPELLKRIHETAQMLEGLILSVDGDPAKLSQQLKAAVEILGQSLEKSLLEQAQNPEKPLSEQSLLSLVKLQQSLKRAGETELAGAVEKFIGDLRYHQLLNVQPEPDSGREIWSEIGFRLRGGRSETARLRIRHESRSNPEETSSAYSRLILQVDIDNDHTVEVDLSVADKQISTQVTAPDPAWCQQAESELPFLEGALQALGFHLNGTRFDVGEPQPFEGLKIVSGGAPLMAVNIEV